MAQAPSRDRPSNIGSVVASFMDSSSIALGQQGEARNARRNVSPTFDDGGHRIEHVRGNRALQHESMDASSHCGPGYRYLVVQAQHDQFGGRCPLAHRPQNRSQCHRPSKVDDGDHRRQPLYPFEQRRLIGNHEDGPEGGLEQSADTLDQAVVPISQQHASRLLLAHGPPPAEERRLRHPENLAHTAKTSPLQASGDLVILLGYCTEITGPRTTVQIETIPFLIAK